jgi:hypothetical protein
MIEVTTPTGTLVHYELSKGCNETTIITEMRGRGGKLPEVTRPSGFPMYYLDVGNNVFCPRCASENKFTETLVDSRMNLTKTHLYCVHCGKQIEKGY